MNNPVVSVLISVRDGASFLRQAVDSLLCQSYREWEFVAIDDGSADATGNILDEYAASDDRIRVFHQENRGLSTSLAEGLGEARGIYVARLDADDVMLPGRLQAQVALLESQPEVVLVGSAAEFLDERGEVRCMYVMPTDSKAVRRALIRYNPFFHSSVMFRTEAASRVGGYDGQLKAGQDYDLWMRLSRIGQVVNLAEPYIQLRIRQGSVTRTHRRDQMRVGLRVQWRAVRNGWYSPFCLRHMWKSLLYLMLPDLAMSLVYRARFRRNKGLVTAN
jgi:glycosyltransferase involved in cell wall biosynthesis